MRGVQIKSLVKFLSLLAVVVFPMTVSAQKLLVLDITNTVWKYHPNVTDPGWGDTWVTNDFNDSDWASGRGMFGLEPTVMAYPINTPILNPPGGPQSSYFRVHFNFTGNPENVSLLFSNYVDDSIIVYLNGLELYSYNMEPERPVAWNDVDHIVANPLGDATPLPPTNVIPSNLKMGDNVLAVALYQHGSGTSDDVFGSWMYAVIPFAPTNQNVLQPTNRTILQNRSSVLEVFSSASPDATIQWYVGGVAITDATNSTLLVTNESTVTSISNFYAIATNPLGSFQSRTSVVTFTSDTVPPTVVRAIANATFTEIRVEFSEAVEFNSAEDEFSYTISGGIDQPALAVLTISGKTVLLTLNSPLSPDTLYTVAVDNVTDLAGLPIPAGSSVQFRSWAPTSAGGWVFEAFNGYSGPSDNNPPANFPNSIPGTAVVNLTSHASYPNNPSQVLLTTGTSTAYAGAGYDAGNHENYGGRLRGLFFPSESGNWIFYISTDDAGQLFLNPTGPNAAGKVKIAEQTGCCNLFNAAGTWISAPIPLVGGQPYYIEGLYKEGIGGDYYHLAAALEGAPAPTGGNAQACPVCDNPSAVGSGAMPAGAAGTFTITQQPTNFPGIAAQPVTFSVGVNQTLGLPVLYQWLRNGSPITNENRSFYTFIPSLADNNATFRVAVTNLGGFGVLSDTATLTVVADTFRPTVVSATPSVDGSNIVVVYSEAMAADTADIVYYQINDDGAASATLSADAKSVTVVFPTPLTALCSANVLKISDVRDLASNVLNPNPTLITFTVTNSLVVPINESHLWRWDSSGTDLTAAGWQNPGYNDSAWQSGPGVLAFDDAAATLPPGMVFRTQIADYTTNKLTIYFRTHFNLATDPASVSRLQLSAIIDDGSVAFLNGTEVHRLRVSPGPLTYALGANAGAPSEAPHPLEGPFDLPTSALVSGDNVLAIAVLQSGTASSDVVMGAQLVATVSSCGPRLSISHSGSTATLTWSDPTYSLQSSPTVKGPWTPLAGASGVTVSTASGNRFYQLVKP